MLVKVAISGGTGFVGQHLVKYLLDQKADVVLISRTKQTAGPSKVPVLTWSELEREPQLLEGTDAIVNLAGESINQRWTDEAKERIMHSRLDAARRIGLAVDQLRQKPVLVNASGISIYGVSETATFSEESEPRIIDFLSGVVDQWEIAAEQIPARRIVLLRVGIVLGNDGGAFPKMAMPFKLGVGGRIGSGRQVLSWIHVTDICRLIDYCIRQDSLEGPVNATAPQPVTNDEFGRTLARVMGRPYVFPVPAFAMKLLFGELSTLLLEGQRVLPKAALEHGFEYRYPTLEMALEDLVRK
jgi:uncharacterized protein